MLFRKYEAQNADVTIPGKQICFRDSFIVPIAVASLITITKKQSLLRATFSAVHIHTTLQRMTAQRILSGRL